MATISDRMRRRFAAVAAALIVLALAAAGAPATRAFDIKVVDDSVVRVVIVVERDGRRSMAGNGTGFVIDNEIVVTNQHVAEPDVLKRANVPFILFIINSAQRKPLQAQVLFASKELDLAVLKVPGLTLKPLPLSSRDPGQYPEKGQQVFAVGYPAISDQVLRGQTEQQQIEVLAQSTVTSGIIGRSLKAPVGGRERQIIQHDASINPGNSGGPLFDACNRIVGVNTFTALSNLEVTKDAQGKDVARGATSAGVFLSPHIANLIGVVKSEAALRGINLREESDECKTVVPTGETEVPVTVWAAIGTLGVLALGGIVLGFTRKREVVRVVESYSAWVRRKGVSPGTPRTAGIRAAQTAAATAAPAARTMAAAAGQWALSGFDGQGNKVFVEFGPEDLAKAASGPEQGLVIGRSASMSDRSLTDPSVSRRHVKLAPGEAEATLIMTDLKSAYGTKVNDQPVEPFEPVLVKAGDRIALGALTLDLSLR